MKNIKTYLLIGFITLFFNTSVFAQQAGTLSGSVVDDLGAIVVGANVIVADSNGVEKSAITNGNGEFIFNNLAPGTYTVRIAAENFAVFEETEVQIKAGERKELNAALSIEAVEEQVEVNADGQLSTDADANASATVIKGADLDALPDDPDELEAALQALAGGAAGPNGGQIYIDGFTGGNLPSKESIREIRINSNPFSAEYDRLGFGRIEILTKPGTDKFRGQGYFNFGDESLNTRNPFSPNVASSQQRYYGGSISGPIVKNKSSFFVDVSRREDDGTELVNATILDGSNAILPFRNEYTVPNRRFELSPRFDYAINDKNTLVARYNFERRTRDNNGIGEFSLLSRAFATTNTEHEIRLTETMVINAKTINETRFEYDFEEREQNGDNSIPTINVQSAFVGGGSNIGLNFNKERGYELQNYTTTSFGAKSEHSVKFGVKIEGVKISDRSESNFGGTFIFSGVPAVVDRNNPACQTTPLPQSCIITPAISPIDQYRQKVLGNTDPRFNPNQFSISTGEPLAEVSQTDYGFFVTDDWRVNQKLTLGLGLRYENQTNIDDNLNFAPRFSFAFSPGAGGARPPKTVFRGGLGIFYDRFDNNYTLSANRFNGLNQLNYIVTNNQNLLGQAVFSAAGVTNIPTIAQLQNLSPLSNTIRAVSPELQAPYTIQTALSVERQLPYNTTLSVFYVASRNLHLLRTRNVNAPVCPPGTICPRFDAPALNALRPDPSQGNIYQYESSGILNQQQLIFSFRNFYNKPISIFKNFSIFGNYRISYAKSDTDGAFTFPAHSYDLDGEYGDSVLNQRHFLFVVGSIGLPWDVRMSPFVIASSGRPYNIISGIDTNGDSIFSERPTFADLGSRCSQLNLTNDFCDTSGVGDLDAVIPRNYGVSPSMFFVNLRLNKTIGFGKSPAPRAEENPTRGSDGNIPGTGRRGGGRRGGGGGRGGFGGGNERSPYNLTLGVSVNNLFNTVNFATPVSNFSSSRFGQSLSTVGGFRGSNSGNRSVELQVRFSF